MTPLLLRCRFGHGEAQEMDILFMLTQVRFPYSSIGAMLAMILL